MLSKVSSACTVGLDGHSVTIEVDIARRGFPNFKIVGLPHKSVAESRERVRSAIVNSGFKIPSAKITVNLAPADLPKRGSYFDIAIALGILVSAENLSNKHVIKKLFIGELSLDGTVSRVAGVFSIVEYARRHGFSEIFIPIDNCREVRYLKGIKVFAVRSFKELVDHLRGFSVLSAIRPEEWKVVEEQNDPFQHIKGQKTAKRALEIAAAGRHSLLLYGPPGTGKTLLAQSLASLLPPLTRKEYLDLMRIGMQPSTIQRPYRAPNHNLSVSGLLGGGRILQPGEATLAHHGILHLDELPEFSRKTLDALKEVLDQGFVTHMKTYTEATFPAKFLLVATANPCPCGYNGHPRRECACSQQQIGYYKAKVSGALRDRIDMHILVQDIHDKEIENSEESSWRARVVRINMASAQQVNRFGNRETTNGSMIQDDINNCSIDEDARDLLSKAYSNLSLSARSYFKAIKISQTIADLAGDSSIRRTHVVEALSYRI